MKERPILFNSDMVKAVLDGRKTQTRRAIKPQPIGYRTCWSDDLEAGDTYIETDVSLWKACESKGRNKKAAGELTPIEIKCPYGVVGDRLWVRETFKGYWVKPERGSLCTYFLEYKADGAKIIYRRTRIDEFENWPNKWRPSIFMPKKFARIWLEITGIRAERVQEITPEDCEKEGLELTKHPNLQMGKYKRICKDFQGLWDSLNARRGFSWASNPFVWVIEFKRIEL